jgi:hypothetical protein
VKSETLTRLTTLGMALFLAVLTWIYLFMQSNGPAEIEVQFLPKIDAAEFASLSWKDADGDELAAGGSLKVRVVGPKADVRTLALRPKVFACEVLVDPKELQGPMGTFRRHLQREDFNLPPVFQVEPLRTVTVRFVRFEEREIEIAATPYSFEGSPRPGYEIESIAAVPKRIRARVPADAKELERVPVRRVPVEGRTEGFSIPAWQIESPAGIPVQPLDPFAVEVKIVLRPTVARIRAPLHVLAPSGSLGRIALQTTEVVLELRGTQEAVHAAAAKPAVLRPYVLVAEADLQAPGAKELSEFGCHILDPQLQSRLTVVVMADAQPDQRKAKVQVR